MTLGDVLESSNAENRLDLNLIYMCGVRRWVTIEVREVCSVPAQNRKYMQLPFKVNGPLDSLEL